MLTDGRTNGWTDQRTDKASYRFACPQLKSGTTNSGGSGTDQSNSKNFLGLWPINGYWNANCHGSQAREGRLKNKAGYTAKTVADVWAGAEMRVFALFQLDDPGWTDGPMDRRTDGRTKPLIELRVRN